MKYDRNGSKASGITLKAQVDELRRRCEAACRFQGGRTYFEEEVGIFSEFASEENLVFSEEPEFLSRVPNDEGNEHQVWFEPATDSYLKATWADFFGKAVIFPSDETPNASPIDYLERWHLHNELFGDSVAFLGVWKAEEGLRMIVRQPAIAGVPASKEQIQSFFKMSGWKPFRIGHDLAYFDSRLNITISDTHPGNLVLMSDGNLAAIDLRVQKLRPSLVDAVKQLVQNF